MDTSDFIQGSIGSLQETILLAFLIIVFVVVFFLGRWRASFIIILAIPISLLTSFIYLMGTGSTLNIISLSSISIAICLVVDDAIVVLENIARHIERGSSPKQAAVHATNEVGVAVMASTLTLIAVFLPLTMTTGFIGVFFKELGWMVTIMITMSIIVALALTPALCSQMMNSTHDQRSKFFDRLYAPVRRGLDRLDLRYAKIVNYCVKHRWKTTFICFSLFVIIIVPTCSMVKMDFMPESDNSMLTLEAYLPTGTRM
jgi:HAE1 family hydrophobic/amphiphilic exporter-1